MQGTEFQLGTTCRSSCSTSRCPCCCTWSKEARPSASANLSHGIVWTRGVDAWVLRLHVHRRPGNLAHNALAAACIEQPSPPAFLVAHLCAYADESPSALTSREFKPWHLLSTALSVCDNMAIFCSKASDSSATSALSWSTDRPVSILAVSSGIHITKLRRRVVGIVVYSAQNLAFLCMRTWTPRLQRMSWEPSGVDVTRRYEHEFVNRDRP